jgi:prepilin-type N-terminal cleavage/methylation domain-containing protein
MSRPLRHGVTLVELIVAMVIVGIAVPPILAMVSTALERQHESLERTRATLLAEALIETVLADSYVGAESIDVESADYPQGVADRLGSLAAFYAELGYEWDLRVRGPLDASLTETDTGSDLFYEVTATVRYRPSGAEVRLDYPLSVVVTQMPEGDDADIVAGPHPLGWRSRFAFDGIDGWSLYSGRWRQTGDGTSLYCPWSNYGLYFGADLGQPAAPWHLGISAKNFSSLGLPPGYASYRVDVRVNGQFIGTAVIPASDTTWNTVWVNLGARAGIAIIELRWRNDSYRPGVYDANIAIGAVQLATQPGEESEP